MDKPYRIVVYENGAQIKELETDCFIGVANDEKTKSVDLVSYYEATDRTIFRTASALDEAKKLTLDTLLSEESI